MIFPDFLKIVNFEIFQEFQEIFPEICFVFLKDEHDEPLESAAGPELIPAVNDLLLETEDDGAEVFVVGEVVPVFGSVEVAFVRLLFDGRQFESAAAFELLFDHRLAATQVTHFRQTSAAHLLNAPPKVAKLL